MIRGFFPVRSGRRPGLAAAFAALLLFQIHSPSHAVEYPAGKLPLLDTHTLSLDTLNGLADGEGAVALSRLTMQYRFGVSLGEPIMAFRGNYDFRNAAIVEVSQKCWDHVSTNGLDGLTAVASPYLLVGDTDRFEKAFGESELLSNSTFSVRIVPNQKIVLNDRPLDVAGMHVEFRPDTLMRSTEYGAAVNSSPSWDRFLRRSDGSFFSEAEANAVFKVGFDVEDLELVALDYNVNALTAEAKAYCREALAAIAKAGREKKKEAPPETVSALENALDGAFGGDGSSATGNVPQPAPANAEDELLEDAFAAMEVNREERLKREKLEAIKNSTDQFLGVAETPSGILRVYAQDHGNEDGDRVTVLLNNSEVTSFTLTNATREIEIPLHQGENVIEIRALNQGDMGKNTALFWVETEDGEELVRREWNLTSGGNAKLLVIRI